MLGPLLFLIYINDIPMNVKSKVRLFADDTALYLTISTSSQSEILKKDLDNLERWSHKWGMEFMFVLSYSTAPQFGVHSQIQISLNLKLSNVDGQT